mgnify:FL=1
MIYILAGMILVKTKVLNSETLDPISRFVIKMALPVMIFVNIIDGVERDTLFHSLSILVIAAVFYICTFIISLGMTKIFHLGGDQAGIYQAMLLGEKSGLDEEVRLRYQMAGMVHILAISGLHISVLGMGLFSLLKKLSFGNGWAGFLSLSVILQYGMLTGSSVSAMRAVCMFVLAVGARILGRSYDFLTALAVSAILLLLDTPAYLYSSSFLLSFGAVTGLGNRGTCPEPSGGQ